MATTGGPTGPGGINIPVRIDLQKDSNSDELLKFLRIIVDHDAKQGATQTGGQTGSPLTPAERRHWARRQAHNAGILARAAVASRGVSTLTPRVVKANASPGAQPLGTVAQRGIGALNSAIMGTRQLQQGGFPSALSGASSALGLHGVSKFFKSLDGMPSYRDFTQNRTANTSYLGSVAGGLFDNTKRFLTAYDAAKATGAGLGTKLVGAVAGAAVVYKGLELASRVGATGTAWAMKSGEAAMKTPQGRAFNEAVSVFDYINNLGPAINNSFKMSSKYDDAVAAVTGKLPDTGFYEPQFFRLSKAQLQFESMVKRNFAMTKAGAMGNSSVADQVRDTFFNAAMQQ